MTALGICAAVLFGPNDTLEGPDDSDKNSSVESQSTSADPVKPTGPTVEEMEVEGKAALKARKWEKALRVYGQLLSKDPLSKDYKTAQQWATLEQNNAKRFSDGVKYLDTKLYGDAMEAFRAVTSESAYSTEASKQIQGLLETKTELAKKARKACRKRKYADCERLYSLALSIDPSDKSVEKKRDKAKRRKR